MVNVTRTFKNLDHPLDKIFGGVPAGSSLPAVDGGFHPRFSEALRDIHVPFYQSMVFYDRI